MAVCPQAMLHAPQWASVFERSDSQPSMGLALQSPHPEEHEATAQFPPVQVPVPLAVVQV